MSQYHLRLRVCFNQLFREQNCRQVRYTLAMSEQTIEFSSTVWCTLAVEFGLDGFEPILVIVGIVEDGLPAMI